jgi:hypothetical protein
MVDHLGAPQGFGRKYRWRATLILRPHFFVRDILASGVDLGLTQGGRSWRRGSV